MSAPVSLRPVSADHCIAALEHAGFVPMHFESGRIVMARGDRQLVLVRDRTMQPAELELVLKAAAISPSEFLELLATALRRISGFVVRQDVERALAERANRGGRH